MNTLRLNDKDVDVGVIDIEESFNEDTENTVVTFSDEEGNFEKLKETLRVIDGEKLNVSVIDEDGESLYTLENKKLERLRKNVNFDTGEKTIILNLV